MRRALAVLVVLAAGAVAAVVVLGGGERPVRTLLPDPGDAPRASLPPKGRWFGFSGGAFEQTGRDPALDVGLTPERVALDSLAAGANSARVPVSWVDVQPRPDTFDQGYLKLIDRFVSTFQRGGGRVLFFLGGTPPWASARPGDQAAAPAPGRERAFAAFAAFVAKRWPKALGIETWNEPNTTYFWRPAPDPARYARLHAAAARAIRTANPRMKVILGGLAGATQETAEVKPAGRYLRAMYDAGLRRSDYDALGFHAYPPGGDLRGLSPLFEELRAGAAASDPRARLWITETGISTSGPGGSTATGQAHGIERLVSVLLNAPAVDAVYLHTTYEVPSRPVSSPERGYGLLVPRGSRPGAPKPSFCALRALQRSPSPYEGCR